MIFTYIAKTFFSSFFISFFLCTLSLSLCSSPVYAEQASQKIVSFPETTFWFLKPPGDFPVMIQPGVRTGNHRTLYYTDQFVPCMGTKDLFFFANTKQLWDDSDSEEQNYGGGIRGIVSDDLCIVGTHAFYDTRRTHYHNRFKQLGFGVEMMSFWVDTRFNMYYPLSNKKIVSEDISYRFGSTSLIKVNSLSYEEPLRGLDYECGVLIPYLSRYVETRTYLGGYHYFSKIGKDIHGLRGRIELRPAPGITLHTEINHDSKDATHAYVGGYIRLPFSLGNLFSGKNPFEGWKEDLTFWKGTRTLRKRMVDPVIRDLDIVTKQMTPPPLESTHISGITFVDNANDTGVEDGSYEHPYRTIRTGLTHVYGDKYLYIRKGSESYNEFAAGGITVPDGVTMWGSGYNGGYNGISATGNPVLDAENHVGLRPESNCTIMGIEIKNTVGGGITVSNQSNVWIHHNTFGLNSLMNGAASVIASTSISNINIYDNTFADCGKPAVYAQISTETGKVNGFLIENNHITNITNDQIAIDTIGGGTIENLTIQNNICSGSISYAIVFANFSTGVTHQNIIIKNNICSSHLYGIGVVSSPEATFKNIEIDGNTVSDITEGMGINIDVSGEENSEMTGLRITNNTITGAAGYGIYIRKRNLGKMEGIVQYNTCTNNNCGIYIRKDLVNPEFNIDVGGGSLDSRGHNSFYNNTSYDMYYRVADGDTSSLKAENNWWGQSSGPDPDKLYGSIDYTPWLERTP